MIFNVHKCIMFYFNIRNFLLEKLKIVKNQINYEVFLQAFYIKDLDKLLNPSLNLSNIL